MIGVFCLCGLIVATGFNLQWMVMIGSIFAIVFAWRWLHRRAPVTANIILIFFLTIFAALFSLGSGRGRYRRRW